MQYHKLMILAPVALLVACGGDSLTGPGDGPPTAAAGTSVPGRVADLSIVSGTDSSVTVTFTQVDDGTGGTAEYDVRYDTDGFSWNSAVRASEGSCATPVRGTGVGTELTCTVEGLSPGTSYEVAMVAYRGTAGQDTVYGEVSNVTSGATSGGSGDGRSRAAAGAHPNEPAGFGRIAEHDLSCVPGTEGCGGAAGSWWVDEKRLDRLSTVRAATGRGTEEEVVELTFPAGYEDGYAPARFDGWGPGPSWSGEDDVPEVYVSFWMKIRGSSFQNQTVGTKILYVAYGSTSRQNHSFFMLQGEGGQSEVSSMPLAFYASEMRDDGSDPGGGARGYEPNQPDAPRFTVGEWHHVELWMKANDLGRSNGEIRWWLDGQAVGHHTGFRFRSDRNPEGFYHLEMTPVYGGNSGDVRTREDRWLLDDLYISAAGS